MGLFGGTVSVLSVELHDGSWGPASGDSFSFFLGARFWLADRPFCLPLLCVLETLDVFPLFSLPFYCLTDAVRELSGIALRLVDAVQDRAMGPFEDIQALTASTTSLRAPYSRFLLLLSLSHRVCLPATPTTTSATPPKRDPAPGPSLPFPRRSRRSLRSRLCEQSRRARGVV